MAACVHCQGGGAHPKFAVLISDRRAWESNAKVDRSQQQQQQQQQSFWDADTQPLLLLCSYNRDRRTVVGPKATRFGAPFHQPTLVIGGFASARSCDAFTRVMAASSRTLRNRLLRGMCLARMWHELDPAQRDVRLRIACPTDAVRRRARHMYKRGCAGAVFERQMTQLAREAFKALQ